MGNAPSICADCAGIEKVGPSYVIDSTNLKSDDAPALDPRRSEDAAAAPGGDNVGVPGIVGEGLRGHSSNAKPARERLQRPKTEEQVERRRRITVAINEVALECAGYEASNANSTNGPVAGGAGGAAPRRKSVPAMLLTRT